MVTRNSRYGWMTLGGLMCLFGIALACKVRDGNRAMARSAPLLPVASETAEPNAPLTNNFGSIQEVVPTLVPVRVRETAEPPRAMPPIGTALPDLAPPETAKVNAAPNVDVIPAAAVLPNTPTPPLPGSVSQPILIPASGVPTGVVPPTPPVSTPLPTVDVIVTEPVPITHPSNVPPAPSAPPTPLPGSPVYTIQPISADIRSDPPAPPTTAPQTPPSPSPVMTIKVNRVGETFKTLARKMLGTAERWSDIHKLNPTFAAEATLGVGTTVRLPADASNTEDAEVLRALPTLRPRAVAKARAVLPLTGTFSLTLDNAKGLTLPRAIQQQFGDCDTVLVSPGSDRCLWITNQAHLDRLQAKLDKSPARESDVRGFKRLYYAQTVKCGVKEGRVQITDKLAQFADLGAEVVLVGIDDHFEVWDAARWKRYTQTKKAISTEE